MSNSTQNDDLFSASLESIVTSKRVDKFQRFKNDFKRECDATLSNAQEWIKAELPIVTDYVDPALIKDELKQAKISDRRKYLLSALLFERSLKDSIDKNDATAAAIMAMHMVNHMWQAKVELHGLQPMDSAIAPAASNSAIDDYDDTREKILTSLIKKGEQLQRESQIQEKAPVLKPEKTEKSQTNIKDSSVKNKKVDAWAEEVEKNKKRKLSALSKNKKGKKTSKKKSNGMLSRVKTKLPLRRKNKSQEVPTQVQKNIHDEDLLDDPNRSSIMVNPGFSESIDDSIIKARSEIFTEANESGVKVHKILKAREHKRQEPGSNTIIMKLASSSTQNPGAKLSIPEQCQEAINALTEQFPGYDMVAIRNMAAEKVGVSPQYIENLNILPEKKTG